MQQAEIATIQREQVFAQTVNQHTQATAVWILFRCGFLMRLVVSLRDGMVQYMWCALMLHAVGEVGTVAMRACYSGQWNDSSCMHIELLAVLWEPAL